MLGTATKSEMSTVLQTPIRELEDHGCKPPVTKLASAIHTHLQEPQLCSLCIKEFHHDCHMISWRHIISWHHIHVIGSRLVFCRLISVERRLNTWWVSCFNTIVMRQHMIVASCDQLLSFYICLFLFCLRERERMCVERECVCMSIYQSSKNYSSLPLVSCGRDVPSLDCYEDFNMFKSTVVTVTMTKAQSRGWRTFQALNLSYFHYNCDCIWLVATSKEQQRKIK